MSSVAFWLADSLHRVHPTTVPGAAEAVDLLCARGERAAFQVCAHNAGLSACPISVEVEPPSGIETRVRRVGCVPMPHHNTETPPDELEGLGHVPGLVPDPLFPEQSALVGPMETQAFWVTVSVAADARQGTQAIHVRARADGGAWETNVSLDVHPVTVERPDFPVTHWFYADALCDWYRLKPYEGALWPLIKAYMRDLVDHGGTCQYVPLFTPPTDGVKRPHQLLRVRETSPGQYAFDFSDVLRWVSTAQEAGARWFEWTHFFTQWGARNALCVYRDNADPASLLWAPETLATSAEYRSFLAQFMPEFRRFLGEHDLMDRSVFHVSDEPNIDQLEGYRAARELLREVAPWMKVADALSDLEFGKLGLTDTPIPSIGAARAYAEAGIPAWAYFCCGPRGRYLNRLMDTPLAKIRMSGWLLHRFRAGGFLHWGYNYWYRSQTQELIDPFREQSGAAWPGWAYGDPFVVYPGDAGPIDSIRWEVWADSLGDLALLKTVGVTPDDPMLADLVGYDQFPKTAGWIGKARRRVLAVR